MDYPARAMPFSTEKFINDLTDAIVADILESCSAEEIRRLIEEMETKLRKLN